MQEALQFFDGVLAVYIKDLICAWFLQKSKKILDLHGTRSFQEQPFKYIVSKACLFHKLSFM
jgi:hypothetical protein